MLTILLVLAASFVAFTNGANANFKGVASLYGSGTASFRTALWWGTGMTFAGALASWFFAQGLLRAFSGRGLVPEALVQSVPFVLAVALGAALTSFLATRLGFPVSTTHALLGALVGAGCTGGDHTVHLEPLGKIFLQPLLLSPLVAVAAGTIIYFLLKAARLLPDHRTRTLDVLHFFSAGAASFARGLNDTPKMAALLLLVPELKLPWAFLLIAVTTALGGLFDARRVGETLGRRITDLNPGEGFAANAATALLVTTASAYALPVSTTHVSVGALTGIGLVTRQAHGRVVASIVLSWAITLPCGALLAAGSLWAIETALR